MALSALLLVSCIAAVLPLLARGFRSAAVIAFCGSSAIFVLSIYAAVPALTGAPTFALGDLLYLDAFAALMVLLIGFVQWSATLSGITYLAEELSEEVITIADVRRYFGLSGLFIFSMLLAVVSNNIGIMWIALEATTLATTLLVGFYSREGSLEAAWKYLILCSTGISFGLIGLILTYYASSASTIMPGLSGMDWTNLLALAPTLSAQILRIAFAFVLVGYGTKVGLVPMHAWLPDAHSRAPSPISGMLSGVLLNAALFSILRYKAIVDAALGGSLWTNGLLLAFGTLSVAVPAAFILVQADYKRLLAYSSIEHLGLVVFSIGLGTIGAVAGIIQMIGHALLKSMLFFSAGNILLRFKSTKFERVSGVMRALPYTGTFFLAGILFLLAAPPSPLFVSEYIIVSQGIVSHPVLTVIVLLALTIIFAGFIRVIMPFLYGTSVGDESHPTVHQGEHWLLVHTALLIQLALAVAFGVLLFTGDALPLVEHVASIIT